MKNIKLLFIISGALLFSTANGQERAFIPDTAFGRVLCEMYPTEMNATCDSVFIDSDNITGDMRVNTRTITDLTGLNAFTKVNRIFFTDLQMPFFPRLPQSDSLVQINSNSGILTTFEDGFLPENNNIHTLNFSGNELSILPDLTNTQANLYRLLVHSNILKEVPDLSEFLALDQLNYKNNYLTFEDLLPILDYPNYDSSTFELYPQKEQQFEITELEIIEGKSGTYQLSIDENVEGNSFQWYKNGEPYKTTTENYLVFDAVELSDAGTYTVVITNDNPLLQNMEITFSNDFEIVVIPSINVLSPELTTDCEAHTITLNQTVLSSLTSDTEYLLIDSLNDNSTTLDGNEFTLSTAGTFDLLQLQNNDVVQYLDDWIELDVLPVCDQYFTPDGDGVDDVYYFEEEGEIRIIGKSSAHQIELSGPTTWDGIDNNGNLVEPGIYLIVLPNGKSKHVTVVY